MRPSLLLPLALLCACRGIALDVTAEINPDIATVVEVSWTTGQDAISWVEYGLTEDYELSTPRSETAGTEHDFALYGLPSLSTVYYRAVAEVDGKEYYAKGEIETSGLPATLPDFDIQINESAQVSSEPYVLVLLVGTASAILIIDRDGEIVWYRELQGFIGENPTGYGDAQWALDGNDLIYNQYVVALQDPNEIGNVFRVSLTGEEVEKVHTPLAHHAFAQLDDGAYAYVAADARPYTLPGDDEAITFVGDTIDVVDADGSIETIFSTWDWSAPDGIPEWTSTFYENAMEWTHSNDLRWYPEDDTFLLSVGYSDAVLEIDDTTGEVLAHYGAGGDVPIAEGSTAFSFQHDPHWTDDGTLLLISSYEGDDGPGGIEETVALEYEVSGGELVEIWSYGKGELLDTVAEGQVHRLDNGNTLINWGFTGLVREVTTDNEVVWELQSLAGAGVVGARPLAGFY